MLIMAPPGVEAGSVRNWFCGTWGGVVEIASKPPAHRAAPTKETNSGGPMAAMELQLDSACPGPLSHDTRLASKA